MKIIFCGAAREGTCSCYLAETGSARYLVDCGMVQGGREAPERNHAPFRFDPGSIDFVLLTHAHISAHADQPALLDWTAGFMPPPRQTFVVHGEETTALALRAQRGWHVNVPMPAQSFELAP